MRTWFTAKAGQNATADVAIYSDIGAFGVTAGDFRDALAALGDVGTLNLRLNSPGGSVFDGIAIHNMLARHKARVVVTVDGLAASIASLVAMAGDEVVMPENAMMMVHNPAGFVMGNASDMQDMAEALNKIRDSMVTSYAAKTKLKPEAIVEIMDAETWLTASEAVALGFANKIADRVEITAKFDLSKYKNAPKAAPKAAYDPDNDGDDDVLEALGYIGKAVDSLADAVGALTGTGEADDAEEPAKPAMAASAGKAYAAMLRCAGLASQIQAQKTVPTEAAHQAVAASAESGPPQAAHAEEIASLCVIAGYPERTLGFLQSGKSPKEVRSELQALRADRGRDLGDDISARHALADIDAAAAGWSKAIDRINSRIG